MVEGLVAGAVSEGEGVGVAVTEGDGVALAGVSVAGAVEEGTPDSGIPVVVGA